MQGRTLVPLSSVIHSLVSSSETSFSKAASSSGSHLKSRSSLQQALFRARIAAAKVLVIVRWSRTMNLSGSIKDMFSSPDVKICALQAEMEKLRTRMRLPTLPPTMPYFSLESVKSCRVPAKLAFARLLLLGIPKRMKLVGLCRRVIRFCAPFEYELSLRIDRSGYFHLSSFSVVWPKALTVSRDMIARMLVLLRKHERPVRSMLHVFDRILHNFHTAGRYLLVAMKLRASCRVFNAHIRRSRHPFSVVLEFPRPFSKERIFYLSMESGRVYLATHSSIYLPAQFKPLFDFKSWYIMEKFDRYFSSGMNCLQFRPHLMFFLLCRPSGNVDELLSFLRDSVCYSMWWVVYQTLIHSVRALALPYITVKMKLKGECITLGRMWAVLGPEKLIRISLDAFQGHVKVCFRSRMMKSRASSCIIIQNLCDLYRIITLSLANVAVNMATNAIYGTSLSHFSMLEDTVRYAHVFSFAPDFVVQVMARNGHPRIVIADHSGKRYSKPELVQMDSSTVRRAWELLPDALHVAKKYIFLAQTQKYLTEFKIVSILQGNSLEVEVPVTRRCRISICDNGWTLVVIPFRSIVPHATEHIMKIRGRDFTARCSKLIATLLCSFQTWRSVEFHLGKLAQSTLVVESVLKSDPFQMAVRLSGPNPSTLLLRFGENAKALGLMNGVLYLEFTSNFHPYVHAAFARTIPIGAYLNRILQRGVDSQELFAFLSCHSVPILEISSVFVRPEGDWTVTDLAPNCFHLIYKGRVSLTGLLTDFRMFEFYVPAMDPSCFVPVFLSDMIKVDGPPSRTPIEVRIENLREFKRLVELFWELYQLLLTCGFQIDRVERRPLTLILSQRISGMNVTAIMQSRTVTLTVNNRGDISELVRASMNHISDTASFLREVVNLFRISLSVSVDLLLLVLTVVNELVSKFYADEKSMAALIRTFRLDQLRHAHIEFPHDGETYGIECVPPFTVDSQIIIRRQDGSMETVKGVEGLTAALTRSYTDGFFE